MKHTTTFELLPSPRAETIRIHLVTCTCGWRTAGRYGYVAYDAKRHRGGEA